MLIGWIPLSVCLLLCFLLCFHQSGCNLLSQTTEYVIIDNSYTLCPKSQTELSRVGAANFTQYQRQHKLAHSVHKKLLDNSEVHRVSGHHSGILDKIYEYPLILSSLAVQQGLSNLGDTRRLERFVSKLIANEAVKVAAIGGSVTVGHNVEVKETAWLYRVFDWINTTFPNPNHQFLNKAIPAVTSAYVAPCITDLLPPDLDLIFLEFTFNDGERENNATDMADPTRVGLERLLRKLLSHESRPAVVNLHYHPFRTGNYKNYWAGSEDVMETLFGYYGVTSLSFRRAMHRILNHDKWLYNKLWWHADPVHPTCIGNKYIADLVIGVFQDFSAHLLSTSCCHATRPSSLESMYDELPQPMLMSNSTRKHIDKCYLGDSFKALENGKQGYQWINEGRNPGQNKFGFVTWKPGDNIVVKVPVKDMISHLIKGKFLIALGVMESYNHMGYLRYSCVNGCSCDQRQVNSHNPSPYSLTYWKAAIGTMNGGSESCELYIENLNKTRSGEFKTKITSLLVSSDPHSFIESWSSDD